MPIQVLMPALSPTMTEGKIAKWLKSEGDEVVSGDVLCEIETDKATMEVEATDEGVLGKILVSEGSEGVAVNTPIAVILEEGEDASALAGIGAKGPAKAPPKREEKAPAPKPAPQAPLPAPQSAPRPRPKPAAAVAEASPAERGNGGERIFASPLARRMAEQAGVDLARIAGSGPKGRIVKHDIEAALTGAPVAAAAPPQAAKREAPRPLPQPQPGAAYTEIPHTTMRKVIAERLSASKRDIPHFYLTIDCAVDALLDLRKTLNARAPEGEGAYKLSVNDFIVRAVALALRRVPAANASWTDKAVLRYNTVDVSVAVATDAGLITPIIRGADHKGLVQISAEMRDLAGRARQSKLMPEEYQGGGFTVSNLGMYGIKDFAAVINPPQACILAVGASERRPVVKDGALAIATMMTCTLSVDHRAVDGAVGAAFLKAFKELVEEPLTMLL